MALIISKSSTVQISEIKDTVYRAVRRLIMHLLKVVKLCTGDAVALTSVDNLDLAEVSRLASNLFVT